MRGGARPGAGAPRGNLNALKTGVRSRPLAPLFRQLTPLGRQVLTVALHLATADALAALPAGDAASSRRRAQRARIRALHRVLACVALVDRHPPTRAAFSRDVIRALGPIFLNRDGHHHPATVQRKAQQSNADHAGAREQMFHVKHSASPPPIPPRLPPQERGPGGEVLAPPLHNGGEGAGG